jgi:hypothetical protein
MRSLFKLSLAALFAFVFAAGTAMAVDIKFTGNVGTGFGILGVGGNNDPDLDGDESDETDATSGYATSYEANLRWTIGGGPLTQVFRFRPRGSNTHTGGTGDWNVADLYAETYWRPIPELTVLFGRQQGGAWSSPLSGAYLIHNAAGVTHAEYWMNWTGADGLDVEYNAGAFQIGLGLLSECKISGSCPGAASAQQQMTPHASGKFGDISFRAMLPTTSAKDGADEAVGGSGLQAGVAWSGGGFGVAVDVQSFTVKEAGGADTEDEARAGFGARVDVAGITIALFSRTDTNTGGTEKDTAGTSTLVARYALKVGDGAIYPEYGTITSTKHSEAADADSTQTTSLIRLVGNMGF